MNQSDEEYKEDFQVVWDDLNDLMKQYLARNLNLDLVLSTMLLHLLCDFSSSIPCGAGFTVFDELVTSHKDVVLEMQKDHSERN